MSEEILHISQLEAAYGQSQILWGIDMNVKKGAVTTVMGRNGVGKTTLLKTIMGLLTPTNGTNTFDGQNITNLPPHKKARLGIGYVPQGREIIPKLTVYENLLIGLEANPNSKAKINEDEIYHLFPILKDFRKRLGGNLSGGQQQQLAIARTLVADPKLILFDEPTEGIQPSITQEIAQVILKLAKEKNISVLLIEQKIDFARPITDYYYFMDRGKMVEEGDRNSINPDEVRKHLSV